jgi:hypothetical protein
MPVYQTLQIGLRTGRVSLIDDDNGVAYVSSVVAGLEEVSSPALYSVDKETGGVFELNSFDETQPYDGLVVQDTLDRVRYDFSTTRISSSSGGVFSPLMIGDQIRFQSVRPEVHDQVRTILTASSTSMTFEAVVGLTTGDVFQIAPVRFRVRWSQFSENLKTTIKTLQGLQIKVRGEGGYLTVGIFQDFARDPVQTEKVSIFEPDTIGLGTPDRVLSIRGESTALELEISHNEAGETFEIELIEAVVQEEGDRRLTNA